jgi:hypothetical protein
MHVLSDHYESHDVRIQAFDSNNSLITEKVLKDVKNLQANRKLPVSGKLFTPSISSTMQASSNWKVGLQPVPF